MEMWIRSRFIHDCLLVARACAIYDRRLAAALDRFVRRDASKKLWAAAGCVLPVLYRKLARLTP
jgi:hypothetical protein